MKSLASLLLFVIAATISTDAFAKRMAPKEVKPVVHDGIKYLANHDNGREGIVIAQDEKTGKKLWEAVIYKVKIDHNLEEDVQWVFISSMDIIGDKLIVVNEKKDIYTLDLKTHKVEKREKR